jgi:hypothetical protein
MDEEQLSGQVMEKPFLHVMIVRDNRIDEEDSPTK